MIRKAGRGNLARLCVQLEFLILLNQYYLFVDFVEVCKINVFYNAVNTSLETVLKLSIFLLVLSCANLLVAICIFVLSAKLLIYCDKSIAILFVCCTIGGKRTIASTCSYASFSAIIVSHDTESKKLST